MTPRFFKYFVWLILFVTFGCSTNGGYIVKGFITSDGTAAVKGTVYLFNGDMTVSDTAVIQNGKFIFRGKIAEPDIFYLMAEGSGAYTRIFLENERFRIKASLDNNLSNPEITGGLNQSLINAENQLQNELAKKYNFHALNSEYNNPLTGRERQKEIASLFEKIKNEVLEYQYSLMDQHPQSYYTLKFLAANVDKIPLEELERRMEHFYNSPLFEDNKDIERIVSSIARLEQIQPGKKAPDFTMPDQNGKPVKFSDIYKANQVTMLDFWASWCAPCRKMHPELREIYNRYNPKGFEIVAVSFDNSREKWEEAIREDRLPWIHLSDLQYWNSAPRDLYLITYVPQYVLVDSTGTILRLKISEAQAEEFLQSLFE